jgi:hypothetical protein
MWGVEPSFEGWRPADQKVFYCDISKAEEVFGWAPKVDMQEGIAELYSWTKRSVTSSSITERHKVTLEDRKLIDPPLENDFKTVFEKLRKQSDRKSPELVTTGGTRFEASAETTLDERIFIQLPHSNRIYEGDWGYHTNSMGEDGQRIGHYSKALNDWVSQAPRT